MSVVSMKELLESGVHFGHQTKRWDPRMKPFIFTQRKGIHILDLQKTVEYINKAYTYVKEVASKGGMILFVGTKKQAQEAIEKEASRCDMPYVNMRWLGGMLTNFSTVSRSRQKLEDLDDILNSEDKKKQFTKKELLKMTKMRDKLNRILGGIRKMSRLPDALFVIDPKSEQTSVSEARKLGIPIVAVIDTNCDPTVIDHPIPGNDDAIRAVNLFSSVIANAIINGKKDIQLSQEGSDGEINLKNAAYVSRVDKATDEDIETRSFSAEEEKAGEEEALTEDSKSSEASESSESSEKGEPVAVAADSADDEAGESTDETKQDS